MSAARAWRSPAPPSCAVGCDAYDLRRRGRGPVDQRLQVGAAARRAERRRRHRVTPYACGRELREAAAGGDEPARGEQGVDAGRARRRREGRRKRAVVLEPVVAVLEATTFERPPRRISTARVRPTDGLALATTSMIAASSSLISAGGRMFAASPRGRLRPPARRRRSTRRRRPTLGRRRRSRDRSAAERRSGRRSGAGSPRGGSRRPRRTTRPSGTGASAPSSPRLAELRQSRAGAAVVGRLDPAAEAVDGRRRGAQHPRPHEVADDRADLVGLAAERARWSMS